MNENIIPFVLLFILFMLFICFIFLAILIKKVTIIEELFQKPPMLMVGNEAPYFVAETLDKQRVTLQKWFGKEVVFVFIDFTCEVCKKELPEIEFLNAHAMTDFVLVTESEPAVVQQTYVTLSLQLPLIVAPRLKFDFLRKYNPYSISPYFCVIDSTGIISSIGHIGKEEWLRQKAIWALSATGKPNQHL